MHAAFSARGRTARLPCSASAMPSAANTTAPMSGMPASSAATQIACLTRHTIMYCACQLTAAAAAASTPTATAADAQPPGTGPLPVPAGGDVDHPYPVPVRRGGEVRLGHPERLPPPRAVLSERRHRPPLPRAPEPPGRRAPPAL